MKIRKILASAMIYLMVLTQVTAFGALSPREAWAFDPKPKKAVKPILECVENQGGSNYVAHFGYQNDNPQSTAISVGADNKFTPSPIDRGQPTTFSPGRVVNAFQVPFNGSNLQWLLRGPDGQSRIVTASSNSQSCDSTPTPTPSPTQSPSPTPTPTPGGCVEGTYTFDGKSGYDGPDGNTRSYTVNGITVAASAFSEPRDGGSFSSAYLYVDNRFGLGVTNRLEGSGGSELSKIDNIDHDGSLTKDFQSDYVAFTFTAPVVVDTLFLQKRGRDSDIRYWIGNTSGSLTEISAELLSSLTQLDNSDDLAPNASSRTADINPGHLSGNTIIVSAPSGTGDPYNDSFFIRELDFKCAAGPVNIPPVASDDAATVAEDSGANVIGVLANDTDSDGGTLTITAVTQGANGTVANNGTNVSYTPNANFFGTDSFTYTISDGQGGSDTATVTVTVTDVAEPTPTPTPTPTPNQAPNAIDDSASVAEDSGAGTVSVLANDTDADGDTLTVTSVTQGANGSVTNNGTNVSYTPNANFSGMDSFTYTISDGNGGSDTATVNVTVTAVNDAPVANDDNGGTTNEDTALLIPIATLLANDNDGGDGGPLSLQSVTSPSANGGTVAIVGSNVRYTPGLDFAGSDSFSYTLSDGTDTDTATVTVSVTDVPVVPVALLLNEVEIDAPNATSFACQYAEMRGEPGYSVPAGTSFVSINGTPGNFGDVFFIADLSGVTVGSNGTITVVNDVEPCPNRTFPAGTTIVTATNFSGYGENAARTFAVINTATPLVEGSDIDTDNNRVIDPSFNITMIDGFAFTTNQELEASFGAPNIYDSSLAGMGIEHPDAATRFIDNTTPLSGAAWYYGEMADSPDESTVYSGTPQSANFPAGGRLTPGEQNTLLVANVPPMADDDAATVAEDSGANVIGVLANDTDSDGGTLTITAVTQGANGSVANNGTNLSYTPNANFFGTDSFTYTISDGQGGSDTATVNVTVTAVNDTPVANADLATVDEDTTNNPINVLANDDDGGDGGVLLVTAVTQPAAGSVTFTPTGVSYTPNANFFGTDTFTYTVSDGTDAAVGNVTVTVNDIPETPSVALILNEIEGDAPDPSFQQQCQYVELRGAPGYVVPAGTYFIAVDGGSGSFGTISFPVDLSGVTVGPNGTITIINDQLDGPCPGRTLPAGTTVVSVFDFDGLGYGDTPFFTGARSFLLVSRATAPAIGDDFDADDDRTIDASYGLTVVDGVAVTTNSTFQASYAPVIFEAVTNGAPGTVLLPDAMTRFSSDTTPLSAAAWYYGEVASSPANSTVYSGTPATTPFPAGGALTPGAPNVP